MDQRPRPFGEAITFDQLATLWTIAEHGSFSAAARVSGRTQGGVTYQVQRLEEQLGIQLFDRSGRLPALTAEGQRVVEHARRVLAEVDALRDRAWAWSLGVEPRLRLAVDVLFPSERLVALASQLQARFPSVALSVATGFVRFAAQQVRSGAADLAIAGPIDIDGLDQRPIGAVRMLPVAAPQHPLAQLREPISPRQLESHVHLLLSHASFSDSGPSEGFASPHRWVLGDANTRLAFLRAGLGWARLPEHEASLEVAAGRLALVDPRLVPVPVDRVPLFVTTPRAGRLGQAGRWVFETLTLAGSTTSAEHQSLQPGDPGLLPGTAGAKSTPLDTG